MTSEQTYNLNGKKGRMKKFNKEYLVPFLRSFPWWLLLWPVFYAYNINNSFFGVIDTGTMWWQILKWQLLLLSTFFFFRVFFSNNIQPTILTVWLGLLFFYAHPISYLFLRSRLTSPLANFQYMILLWLLITGILVIYFLRTRSLPSRFSRFLMYVFITLTFYEGLKFIVKFSKNEYISFDKKYRPKNELPTSDPNETGTGHPNIYYLVFDSYTSTACYKERFNYDNSILDTLLVKQGFYIAPGAKSNYFDSPVSIASIFNMNYIPGAEQAKGENELTYFCGLRNLDHNHLWKFLEQKGYTIHNYSNFTIKDYPKQLETIYFGRSDEDLLKHRTIQNISLPPLRSFFNTEKVQLKMDLRMEHKRSMLMDTSIIENALKKIAGEESSKPVYFYAHCLLPHPPYVIDSTGKLNETIHLNGYHPEAYLEQSIHVRQMILRWVDIIKKQARGPFTIIVQADHGYRYFTPEINPKSSFDILNAWYFSDQDYSALYPTISSVNTYRIVLNKYFGMKLPILKDTSYYPYIYGL